MSGINKGTLLCDLGISAVGDSICVLHTCSFFVGLVFTVALKKIWSLFQILITTEDLRTDYVCNSFC